MRFPRLLRRRRAPVSALSLSEVVSAAPEHEPDFERAPSVGRIHRGWQRNLSPPEAVLVADGGRLCGLDVAAASLGGALHLHEGSERQDSYALGRCGECLIAAVADGVSSEPRSGWGARAVGALVIDAFVELGEAALRELLEGWGVERAAEALAGVERELRDYGREHLGAKRVGELATTLLVAVVRADRGGVSAWIAGVGDSSVLLLEGKRLQLLMGPGDAEFLPREGSADSARFSSLWLNPGAALVLASDGVASDALASSEVAGWLAARWARPGTALDAAHALTYRRQGSFDDRTAVVIKPVTEDRVAQ